jgi:hypothetical protein
MGVKYTDDGGLGDFIVGEATGVGYNFHSSLGAQTAAKPAPPPAQPVATAPPSDSPYAGVPPVRFIPARVPRRPPTFLEKYVWHLASTLTQRYDRAVTPLIESRVFFWAASLTAAVSGLTAVVLFPPGALVGSALPGTTSWWVIGILVLSVGSFVGMGILPMLIKLVRMVIWLSGAVVAVTAALLVMALVLGACWLAVYVASVVGAAG